MKLNASVNGGTAQAPMNTLASAACRIVEKNGADHDPDHHEDVPVGLQEQRQPGADEDAVEAEEPGPDRAAVHPDHDRGQRRDDEAQRAREAEPRLADEHRHQDRQARDRVVHEADLADAAQAGVDEVHRGRLFGALRPLGHRPVELGQDRAETPSPRYSLACTPSCPAPCEVRPRAEHGTRPAIAGLSSPDPHHPAATSIDGSVTYRRSVRFSPQGTLSDSGGASQAPGRPIHIGDPGADERHAGPRADVRA